MWARAAAPPAWTTTSTTMQVGAAHKLVCLVCSWVLHTSLCVVCGCRACAVATRRRRTAGTGDSRQGCARRLPRTAPAHSGFTPPTLLCLPDSTAGDGDLDDFM